MRGSRDRVSSELVDLVLARDVRMMRMVGIFGSPTCVAPVIMGLVERGRCWGRTTFDHVKEEPRMGVRAESDEHHLVSLCQGHTEEGRKAGYQWNTAHRPELREYLVKTNQICERCGVRVAGDSDCSFCGMQRGRGRPAPDQMSTAPDSAPGSPARQRPF